MPVCLRLVAPSIMAFALSAACGSGPAPVGGGGGLGGPVDAGGNVVPGAGADGGGLVQPPGFDAGVTAPPTGTPAEDAGCGSVSAAAELVRQPVDLIWAIDGSGSMGDEVLAVSDNLTRFVSSIESSGTSAHTVLNVPLNAVTLPISLLAASLDPARFQWVQGDVDSHNAFEVLLQTFPQYRGFLRPDAPTHIIVVTDDTNRMAWQDFQSQMTTLLGHPFVFHAIASPPSNPCGGADEAPDYFALAQATGGQGVRLCDNWSTIFPILQAAVVASAPVPCQFPIPAPPNGETLDPGAVQVVLNVEGSSPQQFPRANGAAQCAGARAWYYDAPTPSKVMLCEDACAAAQTGGRISLNFGCAPITLR
jgi:hypothetical protein